MKKLICNLLTMNGLLKYCEIMDQLTFKFPFSKKYYEQDFFVSSNNFSAFKLIDIGLTGQVNG